MTRNNCIAGMIAVGKEVGDKGLTWGSSGNISARDDDNVQHMTASGTTLSALTTEYIISSDTISSKKTSREAVIHQRIYQLRPDVNGILHVSPFFTTLCSCADISLKCNLFIEAMRYVKQIATVPYSHPGSQSLCDDVGRVCLENNIILLQNHGVFILSDHINKATEVLDVVETVCRMNILSQMGNFSLRELPQEIVTEFLNGQY